MNEKELKALPIGAVLQTEDGPCAYMGLDIHTPSEWWVRNKWGQVSVHCADLSGVPITPERLVNLLGASHKWAVGGTGHWVGNTLFKTNGRGEYFPFRKGVSMNAPIRYIHELQQVLALPGSGADWEVPPDKFLAQVAVNGAWEIPAERLGGPITHANIVDSPSPETVAAIKEMVEKAGKCDLCVRCRSAPATMAHSGFGNVCSHCDRMLDNEFEEDYR